jgi:hypothetical protein
MQSYIKDGKKLNPDFELLNELYVLTLGDNFAEKEEDNRQVNDTLILIDVPLSPRRSISTSRRSISPRASSGIRRISPTFASRALPITS